MHAGRDRARRSGRPAGAGCRRTPRGRRPAAGPRVEGVRAAHDRVGVVVGGHDQPDRPRGAEEHRGRASASAGRCAAASRARGRPPRRAGSAALATQLAYVVTDSSTRSPVAWSYQVTSGRPGSRRSWVAEDGVEGGHALTLGSREVVPRRLTGGIPPPHEPAVPRPSRPRATIDHFWAVVPAGGAGTRLWPLSRSLVPEVPARPHRDAVARSSRPPTTGWLRWRRTGSSW